MLLRVAVFAGVAAMTGGLLAYARYQSPEARWQREHEAKSKVKSEKAKVEDGEWRTIQGQLVQYSKRSYPVIVGQTGLEESKK